MNNPNYNIPMAPPPPANTTMRLHTQSNSQSCYNHGYSTQCENEPVSSCSTSSRIHPATNVITLNQSKDVVIGPMTQYQSPVTFNQYMDATFAPQGGFFFCCLVLETIIPNLNKSNFFVNVYEKLIFSIHITEIYIEIALNFI